MSNVRFKNLVCSTAIIAAIVLFSSAALAVDVNQPSASTVIVPPAEKQLTKPQTELAFPDVPPCSPWDQWCKDVKSPTEWFTWGADAQLRAFYTNNNQSLDKRTATNERVYQRYRGRVWGTFKLDENIDLNARFMWQAFAWEKPESFEGADRSEGFFDNLNLVFKHFLTDSGKLTVGRQDILIGDGWLVGDGTPGDGSRTGFFDAVRYTFDLEACDTTADLIYISNHYNEDEWIHPVNQSHDGAGGSELMFAEQDEQGAIAYFTNKSFENTEISPYFMYKRAYDQTTPGYNGDIYAPGLRVARKFDEHWRGRAEAAYEFGSKNDRNTGREDLNAWGANTQLAYFTNDKVNNNYRLTYEYLSGDHSDSGQNEGFDVLWGRWARWSNLYADASVLENGRPADYSNLHRFGPGWSFNPSKKVEIVSDYYLLFADQNTDGARFSDNGFFRGQLASVGLNYVINKNIKGHLIGEVMLPGNYYSHNNNDIATFVRYELVFTF